MYIGHFDFTVQFLWTVDALLSPSECEQLIAEYEPGPWLPATINAAGGRVVEAQVRNSSTAIVKDAALAEKLYARLRPHLPQSMVDKWGGHDRRVQPAGLYLPLRIYRYEPGQHFGLHHDQSYQHPDGRRSLLTFMVYLNEGFGGGTTTFPEQDQIIVPRTGRALLFQHMLLHSGERVSSGIKYVLRSDVLFGEPVD
jgi:prolyl 4-hydroxylase